MNNRTIGFYQRRVNLILGAAQHKAIIDKAAKMGVNVSRYFRYLIEKDTGIGIDARDDEIFEPKLGEPDYASSWADAIIPKQDSK